VAEDAGAAWAAAMRRGDHAAAWRINDAVLVTSPGRFDDPTLPYHLRRVWDGRSFDGRHVLVRCYHGLGDTLQFVRYLRPLRDRAASVTLEVQPALVPLLKRTLGVDRLIAFRPEAPAPPAECDIESMELAHALRLPPEAIVPPYLSVDPELVGDTRRELMARRGIVGPRPGASRGKDALVGVCAEAGNWDVERNVSLRELARALPDRTRPVRLQIPDGECLRWAEAPPTDVMQTAARISAADAVVTVDTMVAHLAGALGRPTWLLLKAESDWRWMEGRADSPWYPTMRLYRQRRPGDWSVPLLAVARDFGARTEGGRVAEAGGC
jgi:hypothetical protein